MEKPTHFELLQAIQAELSHHEWNADTLSAIAQILNENGFPISDVECE